MAAWPPLAGLLICVSFCGCAAITNPIADGVPVRILPDDLLAESKKDLQPLPLSLLRQPPPAAYKLASGDILGVYIEGVLGQADTPPPVNIAEGTDMPPSFGFPIPVRQDGTVPVPLVAPVPVEGLTVPEAEKAIANAYGDKKILRPEDRRILVTLMRPRHTRVLVLREDSKERTLTVGSRSLRGFPSTESVIGGVQAGTGAVVELAAYENDVLHALAETGGLPGLDAINEVFIYRGYWDGKADLKASGAALPKGIDPANAAASAAANAAESAGTAQKTISIPLRVRPGQRPPFTPQDIVLQAGDIVVVRVLEPTFFYTGGLLPARQVPIPRDTDLTVVEAILKVDGSILGGGTSPDNLNGTLVPPGLGISSPSLLAVLRKTPNHGQVTIRVDLNRAVADPRENILVQAGDVLILQETPGEAIARYFSQVFNIQIVSKIIDTSSTQGTANVKVP
ncbi:MAG: polysaccharide biosynthesis/export family protein [Thermoguttaceae bacterium]